MADNFSFELRRFLKTSEIWGVTRHLNIWYSILALSNGVTVSEANKVLDSD
jgi:hypothetical protein